MHNPISTTINPSPRRAFTMLEVIAAMAILSVGLMVLFRGQTQSMENVRMIARYERAVFITENQLHWTFLDLNESEDWSGLSDLKGEDGEYNWSVQIEPADTEKQGNIDMTLLKIIATTTWEDGNRERSYYLETWYFWGEEGR